MKLTQCDDSKLTIWLRIGGGGEGMGFWHISVRLNGSCMKSKVGGFSAFIDGIARIVDKIIRQLAHI